MTGKKSVALRDTSLDLLDSFDAVTRVARPFALSGLFGNPGNNEAMVQQAIAQAIVKIMAGRELGIGPFAAMKGINVIKGKLDLDASLTAALIKRTGRYSYRVRTLTNTLCEIEFFEDGESIGVSSFSMEDAHKAGLTGGSHDMYAKYPRNMLWARAMTNGQRWFCPDVADGAIYSSDELEEVTAPPEITIDGEPVEVGETDDHDEFTEAEFTEEEPADPVAAMRAAGEALTEDEQESGSYSLAWAENMCIKVDQPIGQYSDEKLEKAKDWLKDQPDDVKLPSGASLADAIRAVTIVIGARAEEQLGIASPPSDI
jgi:hypothetical protein